MKPFVLFLATGFGVGFCPVAPGTAGTLLAIPVSMALSAIPPLLYELTIVTFFFLSCWLSDQAQEHWRRDDPRIVIDEVMGFLVTMLWIPRKALFVVAGFFLFRFFDIVKPFPIRRSEQVKGGYGVVLDDVLAGIYANIILHVIVLII